MFEAVTNACVLDEVRRIGEPGFLRSVIENFQPARTRNVVNVIAADFRVELDKIITGVGLLRRDAAE